MAEAIHDEGGSDGVVAKLFNEIKKYAVSRSGEVDTSWQGSVLLRDIADVKRLKQEDGPNLVTQGSTELVHALLANDLVEAMSIFTVPVVLGGGKKLFADGSAPHSFKLTSARVSSNGILIGHYERDGEIRITGSALDSASEPEIARQERMKREGWGSVKGSTRSAPRASRTATKNPLGHTTACFRFSAHLKPLRAHGW